MRSRTAATNLARMVSASNPRKPARLTIAESFGLLPLRERLSDLKLAIGGDASTPKARWDTSSLKIFRPALAVKLWSGRAAQGRSIPIFNLYNHRQTPPELGWSVRVSQVEDFRGQKLTYDSHNGTDFAIPPGTLVVAPAPARVLRISSEFNRGGLKVFLDHGKGLITTSNHLGRALVSVGDLVRRGQPIALSGYSGIDGLITFPWGAPHVHFNVWLDGEYVDPFARPGETSLWRNGNWPRPHPSPETMDDFEPTSWDHGELARALRTCLSEPARSEILSFDRDFERACALLFHRNYYPTRFSERTHLYPAQHSRVSWLDLPFSALDYDGICFPPA
ncbi:MAG: M23 family metallopeptidase [Deltaproteobacteria bacterium]|nr:M23 family metallopeptidase [Deltaproteobacteria bacterium]